MLFFQQSSEVDKGTTVSDLKYAKRDTLIGAVIMSLVAISIMVFTASLVFNGNSIITSNNSSVYSISYILQSVSSKIGMLPVKLFALGIIDAGIIAAIVLVASTSWAFSEALGWPKSINLPFLQAKKFYLPGITCVAIAALIVLIPNLPLGFVNITVQVIASIVMPAALLFLLLLVNDKEVMGKHVNSKIHNIVIIMIIIALICMSMAYSISIILPKFF
jgi:Mn2+/Fe2+ NRAMP family transporter